MQRRTYIEQIRRLVYGGQPNDDATITVGLVNKWLEQAIALAAKTNYTDTFKLDGIAYINNSFYSKFTDLEITSDGQWTWKVEMPQVPLGIGATEGISTLRFKYDNIYLSQNVVFLTQNQSSYFENMREIPNKLIAIPQGKYVYIKSHLLLDQYTAEAVLISGGDSTDLTSEINVPSDYFPLMTDYIIKNLILERNQPVDASNDGADFIRTT